ncbi:MAG: cysteine--tRNA ligase [Desulfovibrionaceae bacterium]|nr:cysteine--tRNA ligase [Desulfovibrionaceae bacterium]
MLLYNTATRQKEEFKPLRNDLVHMYVCGITAYDLCHIGHARSAVVFDVLVRHLRSLGYKVTFIRNFTDIDDKIIRRAQEEQRDWQEVAKTYMQTFHEDMERLQVLPADFEPKATEYIEPIKNLCQVLIDQGKAYATSKGDVYFRIRSYEAYGSLSHRSLDEMQAGASERVSLNEAKEDPLDFALWKAAKPGEPWWESPWGKGRPGWHIECSAMTRDYLPLDIHGGGQDLIFPHHENEKAQSEAALNQTLARFWVHNGFVQINSEKMSKSLGNFKTIRDILESYLPETLRFFLLGKHYRSPIDFSFEALEEAERSERRIYQAIEDVEAALTRSKWKKTNLPPEYSQEWQNLALKFEAALNDDLNTAQALGEIFAQVRLVNRVLEDKALKQSLEAQSLYQQFLERVQVWQSRLGLLSLKPQEFFTQVRNLKLKRKQLDLTQIEALLAKRLEARSAKNFELSDALRSQLEALGVLVKDTPQGQNWDLA